MELTRVATSSSIPILAQQRRSRASLDGWLMMLHPLSPLAGKNPTAQPQGDILDNSGRRTTCEGTRMVAEASLSDSSGSGKASEGSTTTWIR